MARSTPSGGKGGGQSVPYQPAGFGQNQQFSGSFGMGGAMPQGGYKFGMQQPQPYIQPQPQPHHDYFIPDALSMPGARTKGVSPGEAPYEIGGGVAMREMERRTTIPQEEFKVFDPFNGQNQGLIDRGGVRRQQQLGSAALGGLGDFLKGRSPPIAGKDYIPLIPDIPEGGAGGYTPRGGVEAGRIPNMEYRAPGRVLPPGRFQPFPQPQPQPMPGYGNFPPRFPPRFQQPFPQPMPMPGYGNFPPRRMPGYGGFPPRFPPRFQQPMPMPRDTYGGVQYRSGFPGNDRYMPMPRPQPMPRYQPALPPKLGSSTMYQGRGFTPNYGVPRSMIPEPEYQLFQPGGLQRYDMQPSPLRQQSFGGGGLGGFF